ncbi:MAG: hypothetical protein FWC51_02835 [Proteobacteria bacterium]|nr:hypothetical protein [Pseudomonadota bacterium]
MLSKIKKIFFTGMFGVLYVSFVAQFVYAITLMFGEYGDRGTAFFALGLLSVEWLVLIGARYLSKKSASGNNANNGGGYHNNYRR